MYLMCVPGNKGTVQSSVLIISHTAPAPARLLLSLANCLEGSMTQLFWRPGHCTTPHRGTTHIAFCCLEVPWAAADSSRWILSHWRPERLEETCFLKNKSYYFSLWQCFKILRLEKWGGHYMNSELTCDHMSHNYLQTGNTSWCRSKKASYKRRVC